VKGKQVAGSIFFFEKKKQKTFLPASPPSRRLRACTGEAKKNRTNRQTPTT
jgi:hypothetical protein